MIKLAFLGDICPGGVLHGSASSCISAEVAEYLKGFDVRIGTLESALGKDYPFDQMKMAKWGNVIYAEDDDIRRLKELDINIVSLANNHVTDLGLDGLIHTIDVLDRNGVRHFGAGRNIEEAESPAIVELRGIRIALIGFYDTTIAPHPASIEAPGLCTSENIVSIIDEAKRGNDYALVVPHWGFEYMMRPLPRDKRFATKLIAAGADAVIGSHTHQVQPVVVYKKRPVFFSLGNFLFPDFFQQPPCPIWYPDPSVDLTSIPSVSEYVCDHRRHVKYVWKHAFRIGLIASLNISDRIEAAYRLTYLDEQNTIRFLSREKNYRLALSALGLMIRSPLYSPFFFLSECFFFMKRRLIPRQNQKSL